jgi:hypothetical protein
VTYSAEEVGRMKQLQETCFIQKFGDASRAQTLINRCQSNSQALPYGQGHTAPQKKKAFNNCQESMGTV